jgi:hypothetical protein
MHNNSNNNLPLQQPPLPTSKQHRLSEALEFKDMVGMLKPTIHVDEFASKMGDDDDIIVVSFFVRSDQAARDLVNWFEKGYDWVMDSDRSPGEIKPGRYLVYVEMRRRSTAGEKIAQALDDLSTLTEYKGDNWNMHYEDNDVPFDVETFNRLVPLSPKEYRARKEKDLNEMRVAAGVEPVAVFERERDIRQLQSAAGI